LTTNHITMPFMYTIYNTALCTFS